MPTADARAANEAIVRRIFDAFARKQGFAFRDLFAADAVWTVPGDGAMAGVYRGREVYLQVLAHAPEDEQPGMKFDTTPRPGQPE